MKQPSQKHILLYQLFRLLTILYVKWKFGYQYEKAGLLPENYIVLSNHITDYDMLFVAASFPRQMYFVASEHIARWKKLYKFLKFSFDPIMRPKGASAAFTIKEMMRRVKEGSSVCIFPEGVRSWDGCTSPISPSTAKLVRRLGCGLVTYKIVGGYFASPMWGGTSIRKGYVRGAPVRVYSKEQLQRMTEEEVYAAITADLYEDAYQRQLDDPKQYQGKGLAEGLENLLFICPRCGERDTFTSEDDTVVCESCGLAFGYNEYGILGEAPFETLREFDRWQREQVLADWEAGAVYRAPEATLSTVRNHEETPVTRGDVVLSRTALRCAEVTIPLEEISDLAMHGQRALVFTAGKTYYELICAPGANARKFFLFFHAGRRQPTEKV